MRTAIRLAAVAAFAIVALARGITRRGNARRHRH